MSNHEHELEIVVAGTIISGDESHLFVERRCICGAVFETSLQPQRDGSYRLFPDVCPVEMTLRHELGAVLVSTGPEADMARVCACGARFDVSFQPQRDGSYRLLPDVCPVETAEYEHAEAVAKADARLTKQRARWMPAQQEA